MIRFKYLNKDKLKRIGSGILITTMIGSSSFSLSGCGEKKETIPDVGYVAETVTNIEIDRKNYAVYLENNIATIYTITETFINPYKNIYYSETNNNKVTLMANSVHYLENFTIEEAEEYTKNLLTEDGVIKYYNVEGRENPKTLTKK